MASKSASKVVIFPVKPVKTGAPGEADSLWVLLIASHYQDEYSCEYRPDFGGFGITIRSSSLQGAANLMNECRRALGWEQMEEVLQ